MLRALRLNSTLNILWRPPKTAGGGALRVGATTGALGVGAIALPTPPPLHAPFGRKDPKRKE